MKFDVIMTAIVYNTRFLLSPHSLVPNT